MGYAALIGSLVSTGFSIANEFTKKSPNAPLAEESSRINEAANRFVLPFAGMNNPFWNINIPDLAQQGIQFGLQNAPAINQFNMQQLQGLLGQALSGYQGLVGQMSTNAASLLAGNVPTDVQQQIQRSAAFQSLMGGAAGAGTGMTGAISARDLGLTSLNLQQQGTTQASNLLQLARNYLMPQPVNPLSLLPLSDLIQGTEWQKEATYKANLAAYTAKTNAAAAQVGAPTQSLLAGVGGDISGLLANLGKKNPDTGQTGFQQLGGLFGGLFGGGGGDTSGGIFGSAGAGVGSAQAGTGISDISTSLLGLAF